MGVEKERTTPRFFMPDLWDLPGIESWLSAMAAKGLHYRDKGNTFVWFTKGPPKAVRYRLDAVSPLSPTPDPERQESAVELGWRYVDELDDFSVLSLTDRSSVIFLIPILLVQTALLPFYLRRCTRLLSLRRQLKAGLPMEHRADYRRKAQFSALCSVLIFLFFGLYLCASLYEFFSPPNWSITAETPSPIAYSLTELENAPAFHPLHSEGYYRDYDNFVDASRSLLFPTQYEITRQGEIPGRVWRDGEDYRPRLVMHYYQPLLSFLTVPLFDDLLREEGEGRAQTELTYPGVDKAVLLTIPEGTFTMLLLRTGGQVLWVEYLGEADLAAALPTLATVLKQMP